MHVARLHGIRDLRLEDLPRPAPVRYCSKRLPYRLSLRLPTLHCPASRSLGSPWHLP